MHSHISHPPPYFLVYIVFTCNIFFLLNCFFQHPSLYSVIIAIFLMLAASFSLALGLSLASASPLQVPSHVDLIPRTHSGYKAQTGRETLSPSDVSQSPLNLMSRL